jgi:hypothetical protein
MEYVLVRAWKFNDDLILSDILVTDTAIPVHIHYVSHVGVSLCHVHVVSTIIPAATVIE